MGIPLPLLSGAYNSPAYIAGAQRCVNLFPESNPQNLQSEQSQFTPPIPFTHRLTPGLTRQFLFPDGAMVRMLYTATNGDLYAVCGSTVYYVGPPPNWTLTPIGAVTQGINPCKMADNGISAVLVDGSSAGYQINLATRTMSSITAVNASGTNGFSYTGANYVDELDGFIVGNTPGTPNWFSSADFAIVFDPLSVAQKSGKPDNIQALAALHRYVWIIGTYASEIWYDAGGTNFPFALVEGPYIEHGTQAQYSLANLDESLFWLSKDLRGRNIVVEGSALFFNVNKVSTFAIEQEISTYPTTDDAIGFAYQDGGHSFYILRFPSADKTWAYDRLTQQWHERISFDTSMNEHQWRITSFANAYGMLLGGDYANGKVYLLDDSNLTEDGNPIQRRRGYPHISNMLKRSRHQQFLLDIECGGLPELPPQPINLLADPQGNPTLGILTDGPFPQQLYLDPVTNAYDYGLPQVYLRWSDTRGKSWKNPVPRSIGAPGAYNVSPSWRRLGLGRDRVYEIYWTAAAATALNGAFLEIDGGRT